MASVRAEYKYWDPVREGTDGSRRVPDVTCVDPHSAAKSRARKRAAGRRASSSASAPQEGVPGDGELMLARDWRAQGYFVQDRPGLITESAAMSEHVALTGQPPVTGPPAEHQRDW